MTLTESLQDGLPEGWTACKLPDIATLIMGQSPPGSTYNDDGEGLPFFQGKADFGPRYPTVRKWCSRPNKIAEPGDVLLSIRAPVGPTNVASVQSAIGRGLAAIRASDATTTEHILYSLRHQEDALAEQGTGSTFTAVNRSHLNNVEVPLPPLAEQERIVAKVEALLERVNAARERLARVPDILKRFRQSVLAAACSGQLTADWREGHDELEPASEMIASVTSQRRERYKDACRVAKSGGTRNPRDFDNYSPQLRDDLELTDLPPEWEWVDFRFVMDEQKPFCYGVVQPGKHTPGGVLLVRAGDLDNGSVDVSELRTIAPDVDENYERSRLEGGEVLVTVVGANVGVGAIAPESCRGFNIARAVAKAPIRDFNAKYVHLWLTSATALAWMKHDAREVARPTLNLEQLRTLPVPLPPLAEQQELVRRVTALFALTDRIEQRLTTATTRTERITQSVLAKAFSGELVETEADLARREGRDYEPASVLLERIKSQRSGKAVANGKRKRQPTKQTSRRKLGHKKKET